MSVKFDRDQFWGRLNILHKAWKSKGKNWKDVDGLAIVNGKQNEAVIYRRTLSLHLWLTNFELFDTIFVLTDSTFYVLAGAKKGILPLLLVPNST